MKKELGNSIWLGLNYLNKLLNGMVFFAVLASMITKNEFGIYTYVFSIFTLIATFNSLGLNNFIYIKLSTKQYNSSMLLSKSRNIQLIMALFIFLIMTLMCLFDNSLELYYLFIASISLFFKPLELYKLKLDSQLKSKVYFRFDIIVPILFLIFKLITIYFSENPLVFLFALYSIESAFFGIGYFLLAKKFCVSEVEGNNVYSYKELIIEAVPVLIASSVFIIYSKVDQYMIYNILGAESQAVYAAALKLAEGWYFVFSAIIVSFFSSISNLYYKDKSAYINYLKKLSLICNLICYAAIFLVFLFGDHIVVLLFGIDYLESSLVLKIAIFQSIIISSSYISQRIHLLEGMQRLSIIKASTGLLFNVILNYIMIPRYGVSGAAFATLISHFIALFLSNIIFRRTRYIFKLQLQCLFLFNFQQLIRR